MPDPRRISCMCGRSRRHKFEPTTSRRSGFSPFHDWFGRFENRIGYSLDRRQLHRSAAAQECSATHDSDDTEYTLFNIIIRMATKTNSGFDEERESRCGVQAKYINIG